jgi:hypothetical protein
MDISKGGVTMTTVEEEIKQYIKAEDPTATDFYITKVVTNFVESNVYYVSWKSTNLKENETFYYVLAEKNGVLSYYDDGVLAIEKLKNVLDSRRTFWQRLHEFSLFEVMAAVIALCVTAVFIVLSLGLVGPNELNKEFTGIFGIIVGYYFGKNVPSK